LVVLVQQAKKVTQVQQAKKVTQVQPAKKVTQAHKVLQEQMELMGLQAQLAPKVKKEQPVHKDLKALQGQLVLQDLLRVCGPNQLLFGNRVIYLVVVDIQDSPF
jgi:DNA-directed RNA polymerase subunit H (RpoH/RPB5)